VPTVIFLRRACEITLTELSRFGMREQFSQNGIDNANRGRTEVLLHLKTSVRPQFPTSKNLGSTPVSQFPWLYSQKMNCDTGRMTCITLNAYLCAEQ